MNRRSLPLAWWRRRLSATRIRIVGSDNPYLRSSAISAEVSASRSGAPTTTMSAPVAVCVT